MIVEASIQDQCGEHGRAASTYQTALDLARRDGYRYTEAEALIGIATAWNHVDDPDRAAEAATASLEIVRSAGYPLLEGAALAVESYTGQRLAIAYARLAVASALDAAGRSIEAKDYRD